MSTAVLKREPLTPQETVEDVDLMLGELGRQSKEKLRYRGLHREAVRLKSKISLQQTLADLGIHPFTASSVQRYKEKCERKANTRLAEISACVAGIAVIVWLGALMVLLGCVFAGAAAGAFYSAVTFVIAVAVSIAGGILAAQTGLERKWKMTEIANYAKPIPTYALQTAVDVTQSCPPARFYVCSLKQEQTVLDPFLVVRAGGEEYYLEVWNEPGFNEEREV